MIYIVYFLKIAYYFVFVFLMYGLANSKYSHRYIVFSANGHRLGKQQNEKQGHIIVWWGILLLCILIGYYGIICGQTPYSSDRGNYALRFSNDIYLPYVRSSSEGLYWIETFLHLFTHDPNWLFFTVPFLCLLLTLIAYNRFPNTAPEALLFLGLSAYCTESLYLFKQAPAMALITLSFVALFNNKRLLCVVLIALAICFHEATWILLPVFLVLLGFKSKTLRYISYVTLLICVIFFGQINKLGVSLANLIPGMNIQLSSYLDEAGALERNTNFLTAIKGAPYYFISIIAFIKKPLLKDRIQNYDKYLFLSCFTSATILLSTFMYWMWRFGAYCYFPVLIFASLIYRETDDPREKLWFKYCLCLLLAFFTLRSLYQHYFMYGGF